MENQISTHPQLKNPNKADTANRVTRLATVANNKLKKHGISVWPL